MLASEVKADDVAVCQRDFRFFKREVAQQLLQGKVSTQV
jgi:hypothetical protein